MNKKPYILSIDGEQFNQEIIQDFLENDFDIKTLTNAQDYLDSIAKNIPDLILFRCEYTRLKWLRNL
ncbi:MAG: hypothetical protein QM479_09560 [Pseudomonadota bacterium]